MRHRVLVIDDNPALAEILKALLSRNSYDVAVVTDSEVAMQRLQSEHVDVVVSDVMMPGTDGFQLGQRIRGNPATADIPIIYLTALNSVEDEFQGYLSGADAWMTKPFRARDLLEKLDIVLHRVNRPSSSGRLAVVQDAGRVIGCVSGSRARLLRSAAKLAYCELEIVPRLDVAMSRADREKFDLLICESQPTSDVQQQVTSFLDHFALNLPVLFLLEHTQPLPPDALRRRAISLPATAEELAALMHEVLRANKAL